MTNLSGTEGRTAGVLVEVIPVDRPGQVANVVRNVGPVMLARDEVVRTLRAAADQVERSYTQGPSSAKVDRRTVANMTALEVHTKLVNALGNDELTSEASHELDYAQDLMAALDEELAEHRLASRLDP